MAVGTVKFFNVAKGFGFITADEGGKDVFVPAASIAAASIPGLKAGQRISFEAEPDKKGPKAVNLKVIAEAQPSGNKVSHAPAPSKQGLTIYLDPSSDDADAVLAELRDAGHEPRVVDYVAVPPSGAELKRLSMLLRDSNQSLVRKYDRLFLELQLDDRFISDAEFWGGIHEHPSLINGPILVVGDRASICRSADAVDAFLNAASTGEAKEASKPKGLSERLLQLVAGTAVSPRIVEKAPDVRVEKAAEKILRKPVEAAPEKPAPIKLNKITLLPRAKMVPKAAPKVAAKAKAPAKKSAVKPAAKKATRPAKKK